MSNIVSRKELMKVFHISRTHLIRKLKQAKIEPIKSTINDKKKLYLLSEVEAAFNMKISEDGKAEKITEEHNKERTFISDIDDILKQ
jgi:hypothetical protein